MSFTGTFAGVAAVVAVGALGACSSFSSGSSGEGSPPGDVDAAPSDAGTEAADDAAIKPEVPFCVSKTGGVFCDDFDDDSRSPAVVWDKIEASPLASAPVLDTTDSKSGTRSIVMATSALPGNEIAASTILKTISSAVPTKSTHFEFAIKIDERDPNGNQFFARLAFGGSDSDSRYKLWLYFIKGLAYVAQQEPAPEGGTGASKSDKFDRNFDLGVWHKVEMDVTFAATSSNVVVKLDGTQTVMAPLFPSGATPGVVTVTLGIDYVDNVQGAAKVHYDNAFVSVE